MANVKITDKFIHAVTRAAERTYDNRIKEASTFPFDEKVLGQQIVDAFIDSSGHRTAWNALPNDWKYSSSRVCYGKLNGREVGSHGLSFGYNTSALMPRVLSDKHVDITHPSLEEVSAKWEAWYANVSALQQEQHDFVNKVKAFIRRHVSLKAALIEWPEFWDLVPSDYKETYTKEPTRRAHVVEKGEFDFDDLNGKLVVAKLVEGV